MKIPREYGGLGLTMSSYGKALMLVGSAHPSLGALLSAHQSIGVPEPVKLVGTPEQKQEFLPRCAAGAISAFLLTEPDVGSDPARMGSTATLTEDGTAYLLDGVKLWTTNGVVAELLVVMARVPEHDGRRQGRHQRVRRRGRRPTASPSSGATPSWGSRGIENGLTRFHQVRVPVENRLGKEGDGLKIALTTLNAGRLSIPAMCAAAGKWALKISREWSAERVQWGRPVGEHGAVAEKIAFIAATTYGAGVRARAVGAAGRRGQQGHPDRGGAGQAVGAARWRGRSPTSWSRSAAVAATRRPSRWRPVANARSRPSR